MCAFAVLAITIIASPPSFGRDFGESEGEGISRIVGGNAASARRRALLRAQIDAIESAVLLVAPHRDKAALEQKLIQTVRVRPRDYLRGYRVLEEQQEGELFRIRVAVACNVDRLRLDVLGQEPQVLAQQRQRHVTVSVQVQALDSCEATHASLQRRAVRSIELKLGSLGLPVRGNKGASASHGSASKELFAVHVRAKLSRVASVRGLEYPATRADVVSEMRSGEFLVSTRSFGATRWAAARTRRVSCSEALERALSQACGEMLGQINQAQLGPRNHRAPVRVHLTNLASPDQPRQVCAWLRRSVPGVSQCTLWRLARHEATLALRGNAVGTQEVVSALASVPGAAGLRVLRRNDSTVWTKLDDITMGPQRAE